MVDVSMSGRRVTMSIGIAMVGDGVEPAILEEAISTAIAACRQAAAAGGDGIRLATAPPIRSARLVGWSADRCGRGEGDRFVTTVPALD